MGQISKPTRNNAPRIRQLQREETTLLGDHLTRLDADSRYERFGMVTSDHVLKDYAAHCFDNGDLVFGYFVDGVLRGAGELHGLGQNRVEEVAEAAFSVEKGWRGQGVGAALLARIIEAAQEIGTRTLCFTCLAHNRAMQDLLRRFEPHLSFEADRATGRLVARAQSSPPGCVAPPRWRQTFDADGYRAMLDFTPRPSGK